LLLAFFFLTQRGHHTPFVHVMSPSFLSSRNAELKNFSFIHSGAQRQSVSAVTPR